MNLYILSDPYWAKCIKPLKHSNKTFSVNEGEFKKVSFVMKYNNGDLFFSVNPCDKILLPMSNFIKADELDVYEYENRIRESKIKNIKEKILFHELELEKLKYNLSILK